MNPQALMTFPVPQFTAEIAADVPRVGSPAPAPRPPAPTAPEASREPLTPFLAWNDDGRLAEPADDDGEPLLLITLLRDPARVAELLLEPRQLQRVVVTSVGVALACSAFRTLFVARSLSLSLVMPSLELGVMVLFGAAAALGPIYAASVLVSARMPLARLGGAMLAALAAGSLLLAGLAPPMDLALGIDRDGLGSWAALAVFAIVALATGARLHAILCELARRSANHAAGTGSALTPEAQFRVGVLARIAWMVLGLTSAVALMGVVG